VTSSLSRERPGVFPFSILLSHHFSIGHPVKPTPRYLLIRRDVANDDNPSLMNAYIDLLSHKKFELLSPSIIDNNE
jgi:hypothetical protein